MSVSADIGATSRLPSAKSIIIMHTPRSQTKHCSTSMY
jgi:hypothetical protein